MISLVLLCTMKNFLPLVFFLFACKGEGPGEQKNTAIPRHRIKEQFVEANNMLAIKEDDDMDQYARRHKLPFVRTPSGIRYFIYKPSETGDSIIPGMQVTMDYTLTLLDGTVAYSSDTEGRRSFVVEHDEIESGLHKGVQYLKRGDKALIMIPSALAHGLLGDRRKIPPHMPIIYNVKIY